MKTDEALRDAIRTALDRRLSGVTERPDSRQRMLRLICKEESIVKKKVSTGLVLVIALVLATMSAALATGGFGLLDYKREQAENEVLQGKGQPRDPVRRPDQRQRRHPLRETQGIVQRQNAAQ